MELKPSYVAFDRDVLDYDFVYGVCLKWWLSIPQALPLKIAGYHQFHAVREAVQATIAI